MLPRSSTQLRLWCGPHAGPPVEKPSKSEGSRLAGGFLDLAVQLLVSPRCGREKVRGDPNRRQKKAPEVQDTQESLEHNLEESGRRVARPGAQPRGRLAQPAASRCPTLVPARSPARVRGSDARQAAPYASSRTAIRAPCLCGGYGAILESAIRIPKSVSTCRQNPRSRPNCENPRNFGNLPPPRSRRHSGPSKIATTDVTCCSPSPPGKPIKTMMKRLPFDLILKAARERISTASAYKLRIVRS